MGESLVIEGKGECEEALLIIIECLEVVRDLEMIVWALEVEGVLTLIESLLKNVLSFKLMLNKRVSKESLSSSFSVEIWRSFGRLCEWEECIVFGIRVEFAWIEAMGSFKQEGFKGMALESKALRVLEGFKELEELESKLRVLEFKREVLLEGFRESKSKELVVLESLESKT